MNGIPFVLAIVTNAVTGAAPGDGTLEYVDASAGLETPEMEGGDTELEFADFDGDGFVDIVSIGDHGSPFVNTDEHGIMVWFGDGGASWSVFQTGNFGYGGVAVGDVNNDGRLDVGYGMHHDWGGGDFGDQLLEVALGDGTGRGWTPWDDGLATNGESWGMFGTDFADVDHDGDLDLGSVSFGCCNGVHVYLNHGDGTWSQSFAVSGGNSGLEFTFGEVNGDGHPDLAASHDRGTVYLGDGAGGFTLADANLPGSSWRRGIALGDADGDGRDEVSWRTDQGVEVWRYADDGQWESRSGALATLGSFRRTAIVDADVDGHGDVIAFTEGLVVVQGGDGQGGWSEIARVIPPPACDDAAFRAGTDLDHNGYPDFAMVSEEDCRPFVGGTNRPRVFLESSTPVAPFVTVVAPGAGRTLLGGSVTVVRWHSGLPAPAAPTAAAIALSTRGPDGPWSTIVSAAVDNGAHQWLVPRALPTSSDCYVRVTLDTDPPAVAVTGGAFTIIGEGLPGDVNGDGVVDFNDLLQLLGAWGPCEGACDEDLNGDGQVGFADLLILLNGWS